MWRTLCLLACLSGFVLTGPAFGQGMLTPPGASGVDEYSETIPGADGNRAIGGPSRGHSLTPRQREALEALGPDGRQAAALADATGPPLAPARDGGTAARPDAAARRPAPPRDARRLLDTEGESGFVGTLTRALGGTGGGLGMALPLLLLGSMAVAIFLGVRRRGPA